MGWSLFKPKDNVEGQKQAVDWLRACVVAKSGPAFLRDDRHRCELILAYVDRLERSTGEGR